MKIYRVSFRRAGDEHTNYEYLTNKAQAKRMQNKENKERGSANVTDEVEEIEFTLSKKGIIDLLNSYASYPDNG